MQLRTFSFIDILQPQFTGFLQTICPGFMPLEQQAALFVEVAPGISINVVTDVALKRTEVKVGMQIVERAFGLLELHHFDQGQVREAGRAILEHLGLDASHRIKPRVVSNEIITGIEGYQSELINKMRHGNMLAENDALYILEVQPAGYAAIATNEAEKASPIEVLEFRAFGAFGRVYLGGPEDNIREAAKAAEQCLAAIDGQPLKR
jgi:ethanolamine utilization microcompartment shell protein EutS